MLNSNRKKTTGSKVKSPRRKSNGEKKSMPVNPGVKLEAADDVPPIPVAELPDLSQLSSPQESAPAIDMAASLNSITSSKKKPAAKAGIKKSISRKKSPVKKEEPSASKLDELMKEEPVETLAPEVEMEPAPLPEKVEAEIPLPEEKEVAPAPKPSTPPPAKAKQAPAAKPAKVAKKSADKDRYAQEVLDRREYVEQLREETQVLLATKYSDKDRYAQEVLERRKYVEQLREETQLLLKRLAEERVQRAKEFEQFRKDLRDQLANNK